MKALIRLAVVVLLLLNGIGACYGGWMLMTDPSGESLQLPAYWLEATPFSNYLVPGLVLFTINGIFNLFTALLVLLDTKFQSWLTMLAGAFLIGWISIQIYLVQVFYPPLHLSFFLIGLAIFWCGFLLHRFRKGNVRYAAI